MPKTDVRFYAELGQAPALRWLLDQPPKVQDKFDFVLELLEQQGHQLRRPYADTLRDKIYELRVRHQQVNYRLLYFFDGTTAAIVAHGCTKEDRVESVDIGRAVARRMRYLKDSKAHTCRMDRR